MESNGWKVGVDPDNTDICPGAAWHGWAGADNVGYIRATLSGSGSGSLQFGNCWNSGTVRVYLSGALISSAEPETTKVATFAFEGGDELELRDEGVNSVIA